jgi:putative sterol carrier protein
VAVPPEYLAEPRRYFLEWVPQLLAEHRDANAHFGKVDAVAQFDLTGPDGGRYHFVLGKGAVAVAEGLHAAPSFTLTMDVEIWRRMNRGELNGLTAWWKGDLRLTGSRLTFLRVARLFR